MSLTNIINHNEYCYSAEYLKHKTKCSALNKSTQLISALHSINFTTRGFYDINQSPKAAFTLST